jgi:hypothetical protein
MCAVVNLSPKFIQSRIRRTEGNGDLARTADFTLSDLDGTDHTYNVRFNENKDGWTDAINKDCWYVQTCLYPLSQSQRIINNRWPSGIQEALLTMNPSFLHGGSLAWNAAGNALMVLTGLEAVNMLRPEPDLLCEPLIISLLLWHIARADRLQGDDLLKAETTPVLLNTNKETTSVLTHDHTYAVLAAYMVDDTKW